MKFDLLGFYLSKTNQYLSIFGVMLNKKQPNGSYFPGMVRHLLFISRDPIGWRFQFLFRIFFIIQYERKYQEHMFRMRYPNGYPKPTGGVKSKPSSDNHQSAPKTESA